MNWKFVAAALLGSVLVAGGCSSSRVDPAARQRAVESAELAALRQQNDALAQDQAQAQKQIDALSKQLAADRQEQRRFREMMSTNFDLLEQSVSVTLSKAVDKHGAVPHSGPGSAPPGGPGPGASHTPAAAHAAPAAAHAPRLAPVPAVPASPPGEDGYTPLTVPNADGPADLPGEEPAPAGDAWMAAPKSESRGAVRTASEVSPMARSNAATAAASRKHSPVTAASATAKASAPVAAAVPADNRQPYHDPDLDDPANPRQLTANRAAKTLYDKGFVLFGNGQYQQSILVYQNFLSRYPDDNYSDNAQFWIGEAYLRMDNLDSAEAAYRKVLREYEHRSTLEGYKTPDAIYRIGQIFAKRNNEKLARYYLQQAVQQFPDSSAGRKAQRELEGGAPLTSGMAGDDNSSG